MDISWSMSCARDLDTMVRTCCNGQAKHGDITARELVNLVDHVAHAA